MEDDDYTEEPIEEKPKSNRGGPRQKGVFMERPPSAPHGGYRPGGGRPAGTFKIADGETIKVGKTKSAATTKLGKANAAVAEAAAIIGVELDALVATMSPVEIQLLAARMHASAAMQTTDLEDRLRKISQAASLSNRIADFFDSKMPTSSHLTVDRSLDQMTSAELKAILLERSQAAAPLIEGRVERDLDADLWENKDSTST